MTWTKLGLIFQPTGQLPWARSHAAVPVCLPLDDRHVALIYSARDGDNRSRPGRCVVDMVSLKVIESDDRPLLELGPPGTFDDCGVMPSWAIPDGDGYRLYYIGWNLAVTVPFQNAIGLAVIDRRCRHMMRRFAGPIVARSVRDPYFVASCAVLPQGSGWRMWYLSCLGWDQRGDRLTHRYHIKTMTSVDGIECPGKATTAIDFASPDEYAISRPSVLVDNSVYHMWYSVRGARYGIGYAQSRDGLVWERHDQLAGIKVSETGWDSEMICYPHVFRMGDKIYMAYNGNGYGQTGVGLAVLDSGLPTL